MWKQLLIVIYFIKIPDVEIVVEIRQTYRLFKFPSVENTSTERFRILLKPSILKRNE